MKITFHQEVVNFKIKKISKQGKGSVRLELENLMKPGRPTDVIEHALAGDTVLISGNFNVEGSWWDFFKLLVLKRPLNLNLNKEVVGK